MSLKLKNEIQNTRPNLKMKTSKKKNEGQLSQCYNMVRQQKTFVVHVVQNSLTPLNPLPPCCRPMTSNITSFTFPSPLTLTKGCTLGQNVASSRHIMPQMKILENLLLKYIS